MWNVSNTIDSDLNLQEINIDNIFGSILVVECVLAVVLNCFQIRVIWKYLWTAHNIFVWNIAICDACGGFLTPPCLASVLYKTKRMTVQWDLATKVMMGTSSFLFSLHLFLLAAVGCERMYVICFPLKAKMNISIKKLQLISVCLWCYVGTHIVLLYVLGRNKNQNTEFLWVNSMNYVLSKNGIFFGLSIPSVVCWIVTCGAYVAIGTVLCKRRGAGLRRNRSARLEIKTTVVLTISMISYHLLYIPIIIAETWKMKSTFLHVSSVLLYANLFVNPLICCLHSEFRQAHGHLRRGTSNRAYVRNDSNSRRRISSDQEDITESNYI